MYVYIYIYIYIWAVQGSTPHPFPDGAGADVCFYMCPQSYVTGFQTGSGQTFCLLEVPYIPIIMQYLCHNYVIIMTYCITSAKIMFVLTPFGSR